MDTPFPLTVSVSDDKGRLPPQLQDISFTLKLVDSTNHLEDYSHILSPLSSTRLHSFNQQNGRCSLQLQFTSLSSECEGRSFVLLAQLRSPLHPPSCSLESDQASCISTIMIPVQYQLRCGHSPSLIWFRDRGGKGNWVKVPVRLVSSTGDSVRGLQIPLLVQLIYSNNGVPVADQSILEINRESGRLMIGSSGECVLKIRIKDVSKKHGKLFALKISPDILKDSNIRDISPTISFTIDVRSKTPNPYITSSLCPGYSQHRSSLQVSKKRQLHDTSPLTSLNVSAIGSVHPHHRSWSQHSPCPARSSSQEQLPDVHDQPRKSPKTTISSSPSQSLPHLPPPLPLFSSSSFSSDMDSEIPPLTLPPLSQQSSMSKIELWAYHAAQQLEKMKWQLIGQESYGPSSSSVPLYQMSNPNSVIEMLLSQFQSLRSESNESCSTSRSRLSDSPSSSSFCSSHSQVDSVEDDLGFDSFPEGLDASFPLNSLSICSSLDLMEHEGDPLSGHRCADHSPS